MQVVRESIELSDQIQWFDFSCAGPVNLRIRAVLSCPNNIEGKRALVTFQFAETIEAAMLEGSRISHSEWVGPYTYLNTRPGAAYSDVIVMLPQGTALTRVGVRSWFAEAPILAKYLWVEPVADIQRDHAQAFISVDVEALPGRSHDDPVKRLVYGNYEGRDYGIPRLCDIFEEYKITANFMLDYAGCDMYGDKDVFRIGDELRARGHDVQIHFHPESMVRNQKWIFPGKVFPGFANLTHAEARRVLEYSCEKYYQNFGYPAKFFRAGGYQFNKETLIAARGVGLLGTSNLRNNPESYLTMTTCPNTGEPFFWENGLLEIPVDLSPEPLNKVPIDRFSWIYKTIVAKKKLRTFNIVIHSWSLLLRDAEGYVAEPLAALEKNLRDILEYLSQHAGFFTYSDLLRSIPPTKAPGRWLPELGEEPAEPQSATPPRPIAGSRTCNVCGTDFKTVPEETDACPFCAARTHDRLMKWVFDSNGNPLAGKRVIAWNATPLERKMFLPDAAGLFNLDKGLLDPADQAMDIQNLAQAGTAEYDCFLALHVLNHVPDDARAVAEIARVLKPGGVLIATVPYQAGLPAKASDPAANRVYGADDFEKLLGSSFRVSRMPGYDPLLDRCGSLFIGTKK